MLSNGHQMAINMASQDREAGQKLGLVSGYLCHSLYLQPNHLTSLSLCFLLQMLGWWCDHTCSGGVGCSYDC